MRKLGSPSKRNKGLHRAGKKGKVQWEKSGFDRKGEISLSSAPFLATLGMSVATSDGAEPRPPAAGSAAGQVSAALGARLAQTKTRG